MIAENALLISDCSGLALDLFFCRFRAHYTFNPIFVLDIVLLLM